MYCSKCGKEIRDDSAFCPYCGAPVSARSQQSVQTGTKPGTSAQNKARYPMPGPASDSWVTDVFGGTLFLIISILMTGYLVMYLFSDFGMTRAILAIPRLFICIGCWMLYSSCHSGREESTGFTLIQGGLMALIILYCIPALISFIGVGSGYESGLMGFLLPLGALLLLGIVFLVLYIILVIIAAIIWLVTASVHPEYDDDVLHERDALIRHTGRLLIISITGFVGIGIAIIGLSSISSVNDIFFAIAFLVGALVVFNILLFFVWNAPVKTLRLCKNNMLGEPAENINNTSLMATINLCGFLLVYIIQFFAITSFRDMINRIVSELGPFIEFIPGAEDWISSLTYSTMSQTITSVLLIVLLACVVALLLSIRKKETGQRRQ